MIDTLSVRDARGRILGEGRGVNCMSCYGGAK